MLSFWLCFLSFFYTVNSFSTEEKQEEEIKCYSCNKTIIEIEKEITKNEKEKNKENYTVKEPFASLSCIFNCKCNSYFLCKSCYEKKKKEMAKCPICKKKCNNENNEFENDENDENDDYQYKACSICYKAYIKTSPLATCSFFYNCPCKSFLCKGCYEKLIIKDEKHKCPICKKVKNKENKFDAMNENIINEDQKNCCQICTECIKDFFIDC